ncbi:hypothetical protein [Patiriisocius marinus]
MFLVINIYPILLQRHNRIRVLNIFKKMVKNPLTKYNYIETI